MKINTIETTNVAITSIVDHYEQDNIFFALRNDKGGPWEISWQKYNDKDYFMPSVTGIGLIFDKHNAKVMAQVLRQMANDLETMEHTNNSTS